MKEKHILLAVYYLLILLICTGLVFLIKQEIPNNVECFLIGSVALFGAKLLTKE